MVTSISITILYLCALLQCIPGETIYISTYKQSGCATCYAYKKLSQHSFLLGNNTFFRFKVKACSSAYVGLMETDSDEGNMYEIAVEGERIIGGIAIYDGKRGSSLYNTPVSAIMDCNMMKEFYVEWKNGLMTVEYYVSSSNSWVLIMTWSSAQLYAINYIGISTGRHEDGEWEIENPNIPRVNPYATEAIYSTETMSFPMYSSANILGTYFSLTMHSSDKSTEHLPSSLGDLVTYYYDHSFLESSGLTSFEHFPSPSVSSLVVPTASSSFISTASSLSMSTASSPLTHIALSPSMPTASSPLISTASNPLTHIVLSSSVSTASSPLISTASNPLTHIALSPSMSTASSPLISTASNPLTHIALSPSMSTASSPLISTASNPLTHIALSPSMSTASSPLISTASNPLTHIALSSSVSTSSRPLITISLHPSIPTSSSQLLSTPFVPSVSTPPSQIILTSSTSLKSDITSHYYYVSTASDCEMSCQLQACTSHQSISPEEMTMKLQSLRKELVVEKTATNKHLRTLISAPDDRTSAAQIGYVGALILSSVGIAIIIMDIPSLVMYFKQFKTKVKQPRSRTLTI